MSATPPPELQTLSKKFLPETDAALYKLLSFQVEVCLSHFDNLTNSSLARRAGAASPHRASLSPCWIGLSWRSKPDCVRTTFRSFASRPQSPYIERMQMCYCKYINLGLREESYGVTRAPEARNEKMQI
jgi:hypothetical protein